MIRPPPISPLFPYPPLFRSRRRGRRPRAERPVLLAGRVEALHRRGAGCAEPPHPRLRRDRRRHEAFEQRSEEHTSELQSRQYLVCRLLLEKKKAQIQKLI